MKKSKNQKNEEYSLSCIGPCRKPGSWIIHPISLEYMTYNKEKFCPVVPTEKIIDNKKYVYKFDSCEDPMSSHSNENVIPKIDGKNYLYLYYEIKSFNDALSYLMDRYKSMPTKSIIRILDNSWRFFEIKNIIFDQRLIDIYYYLSKERKNINNVTNDIVYEIIIKLSEYEDRKNISQKIFDRLNNNI